MRLEYLRKSLNFHKRLEAGETLGNHSSTTGASKFRKDDVLRILHALASFYVQFSDWHELVIDEHNVIETQYESYTKQLGDSKKLHIPPEFIYPPSSLYFDRRPERVMDMFQTNKSRGLDSSRIAALRAFYGSNEIPTAPNVSVLKMLFTQVTDFMVLILLTAAIVSAALGDFKSALVLLVVVVMNVVIGFYQEYKANAALEALTSLTSPMVCIYSSELMKNQLLPRLPSSLSEC